MAHHAQKCSRHNEHDRQDEVSKCQRWQRWIVSIADDPSNIRGYVFDTRIVVIEAILIFAILLGRVEKWRLLEVVCLVQCAPFPFAAVMVFREAEAMFQDPRIPMLWKP
jgi:phage/plasmid-associated DNA primase